MTEFPLSGEDLLKFFIKDSGAKSFLKFIREYRLKEKLLSETSWYVGSNLIYSASTYMIGFLVPYLLNTNFMAFFTAGNQVLLLLSFIFEFGLSISFLRYYKIDKSTKYVNSFLQLSLFSVLLIIGLFFSGQINNLFNLDRVPIDSEILYLMVISQLAWLFIKNWMLASGNNKMQVVHAVTVLFLRLFFLGHLFLVRNFTVTQLFLETLLYPFVPALLHILFVNLKTMAEGLPYLFRLRVKALKIFGSKIKEYLSFSVLTYVAGFLYLYSGRYPVLFLTGKDNVALADMGYSLTFIGIILVFYTSFRNYLVSRLNKNQFDFIISYIKSLKMMGKYVIVLGLGITLLFTYLIYLLRPGYLTINTVIFAFILFGSRIFIFYLGLFTVLSKTMNYNRIEVRLNIIRLALIVLVTHTILLSNIIVGFVLISAIDLGVETIYSKIIMKKFRNEAKIYSF